ncbi:hypothetical protein M4R22_02760 [Acidovorax sp. GBBC 3334]|uniref:hypothetical protein n=1 Tax=Acidovorax sp. GBBC 3334 TaxID=2940496 RepID=UPI002303B2C2|nr:hypothetical protein [Acidovorax sp. GBBC 3334]MDA8453677.1 hypothetical protein [Acidovorax sp. GBBC 3334]
MDIYYITNNPPKEDGMVEFDEGKIWFANGEPHRKDGPAIVWNNGREDWFLKGKRHRENGPALTHLNGIKEWYVDGLMHREDGPAFEAPNGRKEWYLNGLPHRSDGPAVEDPNGMTEWFLHGRRYSRETFPINKVKHVESTLNTLSDRQLKSVSRIVAKMLAIREVNDNENTNKLKQ